MVFRPKPQFHGHPNAMATSYLTGIHIRKHHCEIAIWYAGISICEEVLRAGNCRKSLVPAFNTPSHILTAEYQNANFKWHFLKRISIR